MNFRFYQLLQNLWAVSKIFLNFTTLLSMIQLNVCYRWYKAAELSWYLTIFLVKRQQCNPKAKVNPLARENRVMFV